MKPLKYLLLAASFALASPGLAGNITVTLKIDPNYNKKANEASVIILDREYPIGLNDQGTGGVTIALQENTFAQLAYNKISANLYLQPGKDLSLTLDPSDWRGDKMIVACDDGGINAYLREHSALCFKSATSGCPFTLEEDKFMSAVASTIDKLYQVTDNADVPADVKEMLKAAARFEVIDWIYKYPRFHHHGVRLSKEDFESFTRFNKFIFDAYQEEPRYLNLYSYRSFIKNWVYELMQLRCHGEPFLLKKEKACQYIIQNTKDPLIREYLLSSTIYPYVKSEGYDGAAKLVACFRDNVTQPLYTVPFEAECAKWERVLPGKKAFDFNYSDINGKRVRLSEFKGRNVFIDVWATWCVPCCHEIPYVKALEHKYKDIVFISLSIDKDRKAWSDKVTNDKMEGIQIHFENNRDFIDWFNITSIPRFIIIDAEGNVIDASAPKPSSGALEKIFQALNNRNVR